MTRILPDPRLLEVLRALEDRPEGATLIEVAAQLSPWAPQRTVQPWLAALIREKRATRTGAGVGTRYSLPAFAGESFTDTRLSTSPEGAAVRQLVRQPRERRYAADYRRVLVDTYRSNETAYLPAELCGRLRAAAPGALAGRPALSGPELERLTVDFVWQTCCFDAALVTAPTARRVGMSRQTVAQTLSLGSTSATVFRSSSEMNWN